MNIDIIAIKDNITDKMIDTALLVWKKLIVLMNHYLEEGYMIQILLDLVFDKVMQN